ncbi:hypothetical protein B0J13DRAFT_619774 [Dactylonectria estremocensis]|uniref:C2H2-type domain-containing protein n=1 Tax=Dactylonectria estremocensis TaxID=1079267 RepID=A0A9P9F299_9HYPO|nr:hypothetical protein B0J13DRAFT_619774 [Dactylonectria estremocensis]
MTLLKRHVTTFHKLKAPPTYSCTRCQESFTTKEDCDAHLRVPPDQICAFQEKPETSSSNEDPENDITPGVEDVLRDRRGHVQVLNWDALWRTLFPGDEAVPLAEYEPVIEFYEVENTFNENAGRGNVFVEKRMKTTLRDTELVRSEGMTIQIWDAFQHLIQRNLQDTKDKILNSYTTMSRRKPRKKLYQPPEAILTPSASMFLPLLR